MTDNTSKQAKRQEALDYHEFPRPGKLEIRAIKPMATGRDLSNAYSPGVAEACLEIETSAANAARFTSKGNLVAVIGYAKSWNSGFVLDIFAGPSYNNIRFKSGQEDDFDIKGVTANHARPELRFDIAFGDMGWAITLTPAGDAIGGFNLHDAGAPGLIQPSS